MYTENNHPQMKTVVETFIIEETAELIYDNEQLDKWNEHVEKLGLEGQKRIVKKDKSPIPFMHMKISLENIFTCLCPRKVSVDGYDKTPIPVEILDLVALSKKEEYFSEIQIWFDDKDPDPVCVGIRSSFYCYGPNYNTCPETRGFTRIQATQYQDSNPDTVKGISESDIQKYLIGKWADVRHSFEELASMASIRFISEKGNKYKKKIKEYQRMLDDLESESFEAFNSDSSSSISLPF